MEQPETQDNPNSATTTALTSAGCCNPPMPSPDPMAVVDDQDLTLTEKRAILAVLGVRRLRSAERRCSSPTTASAVRFDDVMDALKELDRRYGDLKSRPRYRRILERRIPGVFGREDDAAQARSRVGGCTL